MNSSALYIVILPFTFANRGMREGLGLSGTDPTPQLVGSEWQGPFLSATTEQLAASHLLFIEETGDWFSLETEQLSKWVATSSEVFCVVHATCPRYGYWRSELENGLGRKLNPHWLKTPSSHGPVFELLSRSALGGANDSVIYADLMSGFEALFVRKLEQVNANAKAKIMEYATTVAGIQYLLAQTSSPLLAAFLSRPSIRQTLASLSSALQHKQSPVLHRQQLRTLLATL